MTLRVNYQFETLTAEELTTRVRLLYSGRTGHNVANVLGLTLARTHAALNFAVDQFAGAREAARELLRASPRMKAKEVKAKVLDETGQTISPASISRLRHVLKREAEAQAG